MEQIKVFLLKLALKYDEKASQRSIFVNDVDCQYLLKVL